jgi:SAM-dependent methyltransferase
LKRVSEKKHWNEFWANSQNLSDVYGTDERITKNLGAVVDFEGSRILEVGAGTGRDAGEIASLGAVSVALDYSEESLNLMRRSLGELGNRVEIICGDALGLPFASESFDAVYHQGLLEHFRDPAELLEENVRVLKKGGVLLVDVPQKYHYYTVLKHILMAFGRWFAGWETEFTVGELRRLVEDQGLEVIGFYGHNQSPPIWYRGLRRILLKTGVRLPMYPRGPGGLADVRRKLGSTVPDRIKLNTAMVIGCLARKP